MSQVCQVTGKRAMYGNRVSHSNRHTRRRQSVNIQKRRFWVESEKRWLTLTVSTAGIRIITKRGIDTVVRDMRKQGVRL